MSTFQLYLELGIHHIADLRGYDHILFITVLCATYPLRRWVKVLILVTAFTIGHSLTLALATLELVRVSTAWIEFLIPVTIALTALWNILVPISRQADSGHRVKYLAALFFGLIHGLGFSNYLRSLLGQEEQLWISLLGFNLGVEAGQIMIVLIVMLLSFVLVDLFRVARRDWNLVLSGAALGLSLVMALERIP